MSEMKARLLDVAEGLAQTRGVNGFSFHDLAERVGIKTASIHYHFPTKADLGRQLITRYSDRFIARLGAPDEGTPRERLMHYAAQFRATLDQGRMCLCGMVGAEIAGVPDVLAPDVQEFFARNRDWLARVIGRNDQPRAVTKAQVFLATLEGAMIMARVAGDLSLFDAIAEQAVSDAMGLAR